MDDSYKNTQNQDDPQVTVQQPQPKADRPLADVASVSGPHKEAAPISGQTSEFLRTTEAKPTLSKEVKESGVEHTPEDKPHIPQEAAQIGITHAKETVAHPVEPSGVVSLPQQSAQQAIVMKKRPVHDAARWLAAFILRQFDKIAYQKLPVK